MKTHSLSPPFLFFSPPDLVLPPSAHHLTSPMEDTPPAPPGPPSLPAPLPPEREAWTNSCISVLLDEYEKVLVQLGRGHLRFKDWETVARELNRRTEGSRSPEQCKSKIENLKKHYRREKLRTSAGGSEGSRWVFFSKVCKVLGDSLQQPTEAGGVAKNCVGGDRRAAAFLENGNMATDIDLSDRIEFRRRLCERMGLDRVELQERMNESFDGGQVRTTPRDREASNGEEYRLRFTPGAARTTAGKGSADDVKAATVTPLTAPVKKSAAGAETAEGESREKAQGTQGPTAAEIPHKKKREPSSLGRDLREALSNFATVIEKIERTKMDLTVLLQNQRLEQDRRHAEMELERTRMLMKGQLDLAKLICASTRKDREDEDKSSKRCRWEESTDAARSCWDNKEGGETARGVEDEVIAKEGVQNDSTEIRICSSGKVGTEYDYGLHNQARLETACYRFKGDEFQSESQSSMATEAVNGNHNLREKEIEVEEIRRRVGNETTDWLEGMKILRRGGCEDLNHTVGTGQEGRQEGNRMEIGQHEESRIV